LHDIKDHRYSDLLADIGNGIGLTRTPAANTDDVLGIPVLEGGKR